MSGQSDGNEVMDMETKLRLRKRELFLRTGPKRKYETESNKEYQARLKREAEPNPTEDGWRKKKRERDERISAIKNAKKIKL